MQTKRYSLSPSVPTTSSHWRLIQWTSISARNLYAWKLVAVYARKRCLPYKMDTTTMKRSTRKLKNTRITLNVGSWKRSSRVLSKCYKLVNNKHVPAATLKGEKMMLAHTWLAPNVRQFGATSVERMTMFWISQMETETSISTTIIGILTLEDVQCSLPRYQKKIRDGQLMIPYA